VLKECKEIDYVFIKESDETFRDFLKGKIKDKIIETKEFIKDLNKLPFSDKSAYKEGKWSFDSNYLKKPIYILISSRGCPYRCNFCFKDTFGYVYRQRSVKNVLDECDEIKRLDGKELFFIDDLFTFNKKWIIKFCREKIKRKNKLPFKCLGRVDRLDEKILKWLRKAGCHTISIGVESGEQKVIDWIKKGITLEQVRDMVKKIHKAGINIESFFIIGHKIDTKETVEKTIKFAREINTDFPRFFIFSPYPGSEVWANLPKKLKDKYWLRGIESDLRSVKPVSVCKLAPEELVEYWHNAHDTVYSNPRYILNVLRSFTQNPFSRAWVKKLINFVGGGILKMHRRIYK